MNFKLGKKYIVKVSEEGIIPIEEFESDRFYDKDHDDLDFLTDEEKIIVTNEVLDKIRDEIIDTLYVDSLIFGELMDFKEGKISADDVIEEFNQVTRKEVLQIIDKHKASPTGEEANT